MWILELPKERRKQAFDVAERTFEQSVGKFGMREEWGRSWIDLSMKRLRSLVIKMGAGGGHGQAFRRNIDRSVEATKYQPSRL